MVKAEIAETADFSTPLPSGRNDNPCKELKGHHTRCGESRGCSASSRSGKQGVEVEASMGAVEVVVVEPEFEIELTLQGVGVSAALYPAHQRKGRTLHPNRSTRMGLWAPGLIRGSAHLRLGVLTREADAGTQDGYECESQGARRHDQRPAPLNRHRVCRRPERNQRSAFQPIGGPHQS
jgi:hypothetical protein